MANPPANTTVGPYCVLEAESLVAYTVSFTAGSHGLVNGVGSIVDTVLTGGNSSNVTAQPAANYHFAGWTGSYSGAANPLQFTNVTSSKSVVANFAIDTFSVNFSVNP